MSAFLASHQYGWATTRDERHAIELEAAANEDEVIGWCDGCACPVLLSEREGTEYVIERHRAFVCRGCWG